MILKHFYPHAIVDLHVFLDYVSPQIKSQSQGSVHSRQGSPSELYPICFSCLFLELITFS